LAASPTHNELRHIPQALQAEIQRLKELLASGDTGSPNGEALAIGGPMDVNQQQLFIGALKSRDEAERCRGVAIEEKILSVEKVEKLENALQQVRMIVKFRDAALASKKAPPTGDKMDPKDEQIAALKAELALMQDMNRNHPDVTRFAMRNLVLQERIKELELAYPDHTQEHQLFIKAKT
jgi:hypothetical protein